MLPFEIMLIATSFIVGVAYFLGYMVGKQDGINDDSKLCGNCNSTIYKPLKMD